MLVRRSKWLTQTLAIKVRVTFKFLAVLSRVNLIAQIMIYTGHHCKARYKNECGKEQMTEL